MLDISAIALPLIFSLHFEYRINRTNISLPSSPKSLTTHRIPVSQLAMKRTAKQTEMVEN